MIADGTTRVIRRDRTRARIYVGAQTISARDGADDLADSGAGAYMPTEWRP